MVTQRERDELAREILSWLPETATVLRPARQQDAYGVSREVLSAVGQVRCRVSENRAAREFLAQQVTTVSDFLVTVPATADVREGDVLDLGATRLRITGVIGPGSYGLSKRCVAAEV